MLNFNSTGMYTILALIMNFKWNASKKWTSSLNSLFLLLAQCRYTNILQIVFKYSDVQYTSLTLDKKLNSLIYRTLFDGNIYGSYKLLKTVRIFGPPCSYITSPATAQTGYIRQTIILWLTSNICCKPWSVACIRILLKSVWKSLYNTF